MNDLDKWTGSCLLALAVIWGCDSPVSHTNPTTDSDSEAAPTPQDKAVPTPDDQVAIVRAASDVHKSLQADEESFDSKYKGKVFELSGTAGSFTRSLSSGQWRIKLDGAVPVTLREGNPWHVIVPGQSVTVRGRWQTTAAGFMNGEIITQGDGLAGVVSAEDVCKRHSDKSAASDPLPKWLVVTGRVVAIGPSEQPIYVYLAGFGESRLECVFDKSEEPDAGSLKIGDQIAVVGTSFGKNDQGDVTLADCHLRMPHPASTP